MTPYSPPRNGIALAKVACMPVSRASSAGSSTPETRSVFMSISCRQAKSGRSEAMRAAVRAMSSFLSIPSQCKTLKVMIFITAPGAGSSAPGAGGEESAQSAAKSTAGVFMRASRFRRCPARGPRTLTLSSPLCVMAVFLSKDLAPPPCPILTAHRRSYLNINRAPFLAGARRTSFVPPPDTTRNSWPG